ncbi:MAG: LLM class flavin-dependent oxidoreductase, partial [Proteobacteria bacterium]|nr:LLM class flavin-dependent oxidoreductase [Pseudomonadota bacterium]
ALEHVSGGRAARGLGCGWFEKEHTDLGFGFGTFGERFEKLDEALQILGPMLRAEPITLSGKYYSTLDAVNSPAPISRIPIMVGGGGEKKTLRMVAQYADESNLICETDEIPRKLEALAAHCERLGRNRDEITVTKLMMVAVAPTMEELEADLDAIAQLKNWPDAIKDMIRGRLIYGDPDTVGEQLADAVAKGLDGLTVDLPLNGHNVERIELLGEIASKVLR